MTIPDNYDLFKAHDREQEKRLAELPVCDFCEQPIQDEKAYHIDDEWWHEDCFNGQFLKDVDDYL